MTGRKLRGVQGAGYSLFAIPAQQICIGGRLLITTLVTRFRFEDKLET